jgi:hypothetical protein
MLHKLLISKGAVHISNYGEPMWPPSSVVLLAEHVSQPLDGFHSTFFSSYLKAIPQRFFSFLRFDLFKREFPVYFFHWLTPNHKGLKQVFVAYSSFYLSSIVNLNFIHMYPQVIMTQQTI